MSRPASRPAWALTLQGIIAIIFGVIAIFLPATALIGLAIVFGIYAIVDGFLALLSLVREKESSYGPRWTRAIQGVVGIVFGIGALVWSQLTVLILLYIIAVWAIIVGALHIIGAASLRHRVARRWLVIVSGAIALIFGLAIIIRPEQGLSALMTVIGFFAVVYGIAEILLGVQTSQGGGLGGTAGAGELARTGSIARPDPRSHPGEVSGPILHERGRSIQSRAEGLSSIPALIPAHTPEWISLKISGARPQCKVHPIRRPLL